MSGLGMIEFHTTLIAKRVADKCIAFARGINAKRLSYKLIQGQIYVAIWRDVPYIVIDHSSVYDKVRGFLDREGVGIRS